MVANYHVPRISAKDNPAVIKHESLDFLEQNVLDAIRSEVDLDKGHSSLIETFLNLNVDFDDLAFSTTFEFTKGFLLL